MPCACTLYFVVKTQNILANWCSIKVFVSRNFPWKWLLWKVFKITCFKDVRSPAHYWLIWVFFTKKRSREFFIHFGTFFYKNWSYQQRSKGRPPHLLLLPILRSPWTRIFWWFLAEGPKTVDGTLYEN